MKRRIAVGLVLLSLARYAPAAELFVAPGGSDTNPGTADRPLATLQGARDAVRRVLKGGANESIRVLFAGGTYRLHDTVVFSLEDSAPAGQTVTYAALPGEQPVFSATAPIEGWRPLQSSPTGLPAAARAHVWTADVSSIKKLREQIAPSPSVAPQDHRGWAFQTLYRGESRLSRARSAGWTSDRTAPKGASDRQTFHFAPGAAPRLNSLAGVELLIIPSHYWAMNILPVESLDSKQGLLRTSRAGTYPLAKNGMAQTAWFENSLEVLDEPGEWVLDAENALVYYWPEDGQPADDEVAAPLLTEMVRVEGQIDYAGAEDKPVSGLVFQGLTFTGGDRFSWHGASGWGLQHDWERFDSPSAMLRFRGSQRCGVEGCRFVAAGASGVRFDLTALGNRVEGCEFSHLGGVAVLLAGYGPGTKDVNRENEVRNNLIHHIGELYWGSSAVFAWQSGGNRIAGNTVHHVPYTGITVSGRIHWGPAGAGECSQTIRRDEVALDLSRAGGNSSWYDREKYLHGRRNLVERNDIHHAMEVLGDGNCIYVSGTGGGNVVRENYCHDCTGRYMNAAIRCDDDQHDTLIERNIIHRTSGWAEGIISKGDNDIVENIVADLRFNGTQHRGYLVFPYSSPKGSTIERNVFYACEKGQITCGEGKARNKKDADPRLRDTQADFNIYFSTVEADWGQRHLARHRPTGVELHSVAADPMFTDPERGNFRFREGSPALKLGIHQPIVPSDTGRR